MLAKRMHLSESEISRASEKIMRNLFAEQNFIKCPDVGFYYPHKGEVDTRKMIERSILFGKTVYLPKIIHDEMVFCKFAGFENLVKGKYEIMEPAESEEGEPKIIIVPAIAFDLEKHRLGFGKGYYDKWLHKHEALALGVCYQWQLVNKLPKEEHDVQMDKIISENWILE